MAKKKKQTSLIGLIIVVALLGGGIALAMSHSPGEGGVVPKAPEGYDDSWGKLDSPVSKATVTHVLVSWKGAGVNTIKDPERSKEGARELIEEIWAKFRADPTESNWKELQVKYNEDSGPVHNKYEIPGNLVQPFQDTGKSTEVGKARICESNYGYHLIRRES